MKNEEKELKNMELTDDQLEAASGGCKARIADKSSKKTEMEKQKENKKPAFITTIP